MLTVLPPMVRLVDYAVVWHYASQPEWYAASFGWQNIYFQGLASDWESSGPWTLERSFSFPAALDNPSFGSLPRLLSASQS